METKSLVSYHFDRQINIFKPSHLLDQLFPKLYLHTKLSSSHDCMNDVVKYQTGGIFGLDFSPSGSILATACENRCILFFDPLNQRIVHNVPNAHQNAVNVVRFLDDRSLFSASDDRTVALWDIRNLKGNVREFRGHTNWVKNIEYIPSCGALITSGFDGCINMWDVNKFTNDEKDCSFEQLFYTKGLMRMRITPDYEKMVISTQWGYFIVIHNLDLTTLAQDLKGFRPDNFWLMMKSGDPIFGSSLLDKLYLFDAPRNRVEIILDFPSENDPENITSVVPHPQSWCILSRNTNMNDRCEWTCVHDIQLPCGSELKEAMEDAREAGMNDSKRVQIVEEYLRNRIPSTGRESVENVFRNHQNAFDGPARVEPEDQELSELPPFEDESESPLDNDVDISDPDPDARPSSSNDSFPVHNNRVYFRVQSGSFRAHVSFNDGERQHHRALFIYEPSSSTSAAWNRLVSINGEPNSETASTTATEVPPTLVILGANGQNGSTGTPMAADVNIDTPKAYSRLMYYKQEPNVGRGFIKAQSWSPDGRVIASPYAYGVRLLSFNEECSELCDIAESQKWLRLSQSSKEMHELGLHIAHERVVLCTKFSPKHPILVSGCLSGRVAFYQPVF